MREPITYSERTHPRLYRAGRMTKAGLLRTSRQLSHAQNSADFTGDTELSEWYAASRANLFAAYKQGRDAA